MAPLTRSTLSADTKDALARDVPADPGARAALRDGLAYYGGVAAAEQLVFRTRRPAVARLARTLFEDARAATSVRRGHDARLYKATTFEIDLGSARRGDGAAAPAQARANGARSCARRSCAPARSPRHSTGTTSSSCSATTRARIASRD